MNFKKSFVVGFVSNFLAKFEIHETYSQHNVLLAQKLAGNLFFNSALVAYITATFYSHNIYGPGGLIYL